MKHLTRLSILFLVLFAAVACDQETPSAPEADVPVLTDARFGIGCTEETLPSGMIIVDCDSTQWYAEGRREEYSQSFDVGEMNRDPYTGHFWFIISLCIEDCT